MSLSNCSCVIATSPTSPTLPPPPPQPASASPRAATGIRKRKRLCLMEKAPRPAEASRCLARVQYSSDEGQCGAEPVAILTWFFPERDFALGGRVDRSVDAPAQVTQLLGAEHERADRRAAVAEDEVVGADPRELELGLLDREEVLDGLRNRAVAVFGGGVQLHQLVLGLRQRDAAVQVDLER